MHMHVKLLNKTSFIQTSIAFPCSHKMFSGFFETKKLLMNTSTRVSAIIILPNIII